jgi:hypothetical protein
VVADKSAEIVADTDVRKPMMRHTAAVMQTPFSHAKLWSVQGQALVKSNCSANTDLRRKIPIPVARPDVVNGDSLIWLKDTPRNETGKPKLGRVKPTHLGGADASRVRYTRGNLDPSSPIVSK